MNNSISLIIICFSLVITTSYNQYSLKADNNNSIKVKESLDTSLENIGSALRSSDFKRVCAEALYSQKIISTNINELMKLEPYYDWLQIKNLIKKVSKKYCLAKNTD